MSHGLEHVSGVLRGGHDFLLGEDLVPDGVVMRRTGGPLEGCMGLQVEVPVAGFCDAAVDDGAVGGVLGAVGVFFAGRVEAGMVAFADDDDGEAREVLGCLRGWVDCFAGVPEQWEFLFCDEAVLALGDAVAVDDNVLGVAALVLGGPAAEVFFHHRVQGFDHLVAGLRLDANLGGPLAEVGVRGGHHCCDTRCALGGAGRRMGDIDADEHCLAFTDNAELVWPDDLVHAPELEVELQADVGEVLGVTVLEALSEHVDVADAIANVTGLLDKIVYAGVVEGKDRQYQTGFLACELLDFGVDARLIVVALDHDSVDFGLIRVDTNFLELP